MKKVNIREKFNTTLGLIFIVKNDNIIKVNDIIDTAEGQYRVNRIQFSKDPGKLNQVGLIVSKE